MLLSYHYQPAAYFLYTFTLSWLPLFFTAYLSRQKEKSTLIPFLLLLALSAPCIVALAFIFGSANEVLIKDFMHRLVLFDIDSYSTVVLFIIIPLAFLLSTILSLFFGQSIAQFQLNQQLKTINGAIGLLLLTVLAPLLEELGWRGYAVDSLGTYFKPITTALIFGMLWSLWHLPLYFIQGFYQYQLRRQGVIYIINSFFSIIPLAVIFHYCYLRCHKSIMLIILAHALCNAFATMFNTKQLTKCIFSVVLTLVAVAIYCTGFTHS